VLCHCVGRQVFLRIQRLIDLGSRCIIFKLFFLFLHKGFLKETAQHDERVRLLNGVKVFSIEVFLFTDKLFAIIAAEVQVLPLTDMWWQYFHRFEMVVGGVFSGEIIQFVQQLWMLILN
jgi:hypothetical protein